MPGRLVLLLAALALSGCRYDVLLGASACKEVMEKDGTMFRICESLSSVTVEQLGPASAEQLRERYRLRKEAHEAGLSVLIQNAAPAPPRR